MKLGSAFANPNRHTVPTVIGHEVRNHDAVSIHLMITVVFDTVKQVATDSIANYKAMVGDIGSNYSMVAALR